MSRIIPPSKPCISEEDMQAVAMQVQSGMHATGKTTEMFEKKIAEYVGIPFAKATTSGTTALHLALQVLSIQQGDEVIIPSYVCHSLLHAVNYCKATPVLVDIDPDFVSQGCNISVGTIKPLLTKKTKAIIVPHMFGTPVNIDEILDFKIPVIEDCCQSIGAKDKGKRIGSKGIMSVFSFYATKVLSTGQGGMVVTSSKEIKKRLDYSTRGDHEEEYDIAYNYGLTDIQSALGITQLAKLEKFIERRKKIAEKYDAAFKDCNFKIFPRKEGSFPFRYLIKFSTAEERERFQNALREKGILTNYSVFRPLHRYLGLDPQRFRNTEEAHETSMYIPLYPAMSEEDIEYVIQRVIETAKEVPSLWH